MIVRGKIRASFIRVLNRHLDSKIDDPLPWACPAVPAQGSDKKTRLVHLFEQKMGSFRKKCQGRFGQRSLDGINIVEEAEEYWFRVAKELIGFRSRRPLYMRSRPSSILVDELDAGGLECMS